LWHVSGMLCSKGGIEKSIIHGGSARMKSMISPTTTTKEGTIL
jgi:hypothetical protein